jgi:hypothetical protein
MTHFSFFDKDQRNDEHFSSSGLSFFIGHSSANPIFFLLLDKRVKSEIRAFK